MTMMRTDVVIGSEQAIAGSRRYYSSDLILMRKHLKCTTQIDPVEDEPEAEEARTMMW